MWLSNRFSSAGSIQSRSAMNFSTTFPSGVITYVSGYLKVPYSEAISALGSCATSKESLNRCRKSLYAFSSWSTETPSTTTPFGPSVRAIAFRLGSSAIHGGHQVAQKFSTNNFPPKLLRVICVPRLDVTAKFGAVSPTFTSRSRSESPIRATKASAKTPAEIFNDLSEICMGRKITSVSPCLPLASNRT